MATITSFTAARMLQIEDGTVVDGRVNELGSLILTTRGGASIDAGAVMDPLLPGTNAQYYRGDKTWQTLDKTAIGLNNVDNTSDLLKPIPTSVQTQLDKLPKGLRLQSRVITNQGPYGSGETVVSRIGTFDFKANRKYRIEFRYEYAGNTVGNYVAVNVNTCAVADGAAAVTGLTKLGGSSVRVNGVSSGEAGVPVVGYYFPIADVSLQVKATTFVWNGGGTVTLQANATNPMNLTIYDEGMT